jgi:hypothetical protein
MPPSEAKDLGALDDFPIAQVPDIPLWSENYAFMFADAQHGLAIMNLMGRWTTDPSVWREFFVVGLPGERVLYQKAFGKAATKKVAAAALMRIETIRSGEKFRLLFDGPVTEDSRASLLAKGAANGPAKRCQMDLVMIGAAPVWDMSGHAQGAEALAGKMHVEQVGVVSGVLAYDNTEYRIKDGFAQRDHSRGVREVSRFKRHCWAQGHFPDVGVTFNLYAMEVFGAPAPMMNATISKGDKRYPAEITHIDFMEGPEEGRKLWTISIKSELGAMTFKTKEVFVSLPVSFTCPWDIHAGFTPRHHSAASYEEAVVWEWDGHKGVGWSERSFNDRIFEQ